jgi:hypothetical protein
LQFRCRSHGRAEAPRIDFSWKNFTGRDYDTLVMSVLNGGRRLWPVISCDPYASTGNCSSASVRLESGETYVIVATLTQRTGNVTRDKTEHCSIRTGRCHTGRLVASAFFFFRDLAQVSTASIRHELLNDTAVRVIWRNVRSRVDARLLHLESDLVLSPADVDRHHSALFVGLAEATVYQLQLNIIAQDAASSLIQTTDYFVVTGRPARRSRVATARCDYLKISARRASSESLVRRTTR